MRMLGITKIQSRSIGTVNGVTPVALPSSPTRYRTGLEIHNPDSSRHLWVCPVARGAAPPLITMTTKIYAIGPQQTLSLGYRDTIDVYVVNDSGSSATSAYVVQEVGL